MFIESVRARATCNTIISSHPISSHRPCISPMLHLLFFSSLFPSHCLLIYLSLSLLCFPPCLSLLGSPLPLSQFYFHHAVLYTLPLRPLLFSARHLIPRLRDVHSILSHLPEVTRDLLCRPHFPWVPPASSFISNSANAPTSSDSSIYTLHFCPRHHRLQRFGNVILDARHQVARD